MYIVTKLEYLQVFFYDQVPGTSIEEAHTALQNHSWNTNRAVRYLKIEQLFRLGAVTNRDECERELKHFNWDIQNAASSLIDKCHLGSVV